MKRMDGQNPEQESERTRTLKNQVENRGETTKITEGYITLSYLTSWADDEIQVISAIKKKDKGRDRRHGTDHPEGKTSE